MYIQPNKINKEHIRHTMKKTGISGTSIASFVGDEPIETIPIGVDHKSGNQLSETSQFRVASLSKPVFAYLVLKLIADNKSGKAISGAGEFKLPGEVKDFNLDTPLWEIDPDILEKFSKDDQEKAKKITARFILSHQTGLPGQPSDGLLKFLFEPGTEYGYSNPGILLLQEFIERLTGSNLQALAKVNVFDHLKMHYSSFLPTEYRINTGKHDKKEILSQMKATNSLHTTANDYALFIKGWLEDMKLEGNEILKEAFTPQMSIEHDKWAAKQGLTTEERKKIAWGLGWGLQLNEKGEVECAFHSGDMNEWRALAAFDVPMDKKEKISENNIKDDNVDKGIVFFANSKNGLILADQIINADTVELNDGLKYVFDKFGFARKVELGFEGKEFDRICKIITRNELDIPALQEKGLIKITDRKNYGILSIKCEPGCSFYNRVIFNEVENFRKENKLDEKNCSVKILKIENKEEDENDKILLLTIKIKDPKMYNRFIDKLQKEDILPTSTPPKNTESIESNYKPPTPLSTKLTLDPSDN